MKNPFDDKHDHTAQALGAIGLLLWLLALTDPAELWGLMPLGFLLAIPAIDGWFRN